MSPETTSAGATGDQIGRSYKARFSCMTYLDLLRKSKKTIDYSGLSPKRPYNS